MQHLDSLGFFVGGSRFLEIDVPFVLGAKVACM